MTYTMTSESMVNQSDDDMKFLLLKAVHMHCQEFENNTLSQFVSNLA